MHKFNDMDKIEVPEQLDKVIDHAILEGKYKRKYKKAKINISAFLMLFVMCSFIIPLNVFQGFADTMIDTPGIGIIARIFTFRNYEDIDNKYYTLNVRYPNIQDVDDESSDFHINMEINRIISKEVKKSKERSFEYFTSFVETGGESDEFPGVDIKIDYEIKCDNDEYLSFVIKKSETLGNAYNKWYVYNIDSTDGRLLKINQFLGPNYKNKIVESVEREIKTWTTEKKDLLFDEYNISDYIDDDMQYYINKANHAVVIFDKYTIACGYAGILEFEIIK